ncbi:armadillo-type protein [Mycena leptocephala]|nr:armadillo-type protein [Mycena leptocephala]
MPCSRVERGDHGALVDPTGASDLHIAALACYETGSLVVQHAFENLEESAKDGIVDELLGQGAAIFGRVAKSRWGSYCIQHTLKHGSEKHRQMALEHILTGLLEFATNEQGSQSVVKALKEGGKETLDRVVQRMCEPAKVLVLIASVLPTADKDQHATLYDYIHGRIVTLRSCKTGSKVIWLFYVHPIRFRLYPLSCMLFSSNRMRAYYGAKTYIRLHDRSILCTPDIIRRFSFHHSQLYQTMQHHRYPSQGALVVT